MHGAAMKIDQAVPHKTNENIFDVHMAVHRNIFL